MPFKTKSKKIAAGKHRIALTEDGLVAYSKGIVGETKHDPVKGKNVGTYASGSTVLGSDIKSELFRIVLLASGIIGLQLALKLSNIPIFK